MDQKGYDLQLTKYADRGLAGDVLLLRHRARSESLHGFSVGVDAVTGGAEGGAGRSQAGIPRKGCYRLGGDPEGKNLAALGEESFGASAIAS